MPELSIIVISYNTKDITKTCLDTIVASLETSPSLESEIIVVDNNSPDDSATMLKDYQKKLSQHKSITMHTIFSNKNLGFGIGNNEAVEIATGEYLLFLNSDTETLETAIPLMLETFKKESFDFAGARLLNKNLTIQPSVGRFYTLIVSFIALFLFGDRWHFTRYSPTSIQQVDWVSGACFICSRKTYDEINGFDPEVFLYWEEVDLFYRAYLKGLTVGFFPKPTFIHLEGASSGNRTAPILKVFQGYIFFYKKHYSPLQVRMIRYMLQLKALLSIAIGTITRNTYLVSTYTQAYEIAQKS